MSFRLTNNLFAYLTALWAFLMLAWFVLLHPMVIGLFILAFLLAVFHKRLRLDPPPGLWLLFSLAALAAAIYGWIVLGERLYSVVYLFLYLEINKLWTGTATRDLLHVYALTFFQVLAASVSTASLAFAPALIVYLFLILGALITTTMRRDAEIAFNKQGKTVPSRKNPASIHRIRHHEKLRLESVYQKKFFTSGFMRWLTATLAIVITMGLGLFFIIPRLQAQSFLRGFGHSGSDQVMSGFSDSVEFTGVEEIQTDPTIVMRAFPIAGYRYSAGLPDIGIMRLRGTSLDHYDGRRWSKQNLTSTESYLSERRKTVFFEQRPILGESSAYHQTLINLEPSRRGYIFGPDRALTYEFESPIDVRIDRDTESLQNVSAGWSMPLKYVVNSVDLSDPEAIVARGFNTRRQSDSSLEEAVRGFQDGLRALLFGTDQDGFYRKYLQLPDHPDIDTVRRIADEWSKGMTPGPEMIAAFEHRLKRDYQYSLEIDFASKPDHLSRFLLEERAGHCEYFATALALMLRTRGIPARIVNGYASDEWVNSGGGYFLVRQEHAHSWVEAYIPDKGWITYDPTPDNGIGGSRIPATFYRSFTRWFDTVKLYWYERIIDYDADDQTFLYRFVFRSLDVVPDFRSMFGPGMIDSGNELFIRRRPLIIGIILFVIAILGLLLYREIRKEKHRKANTGGPSRRDSSAAREAVREYLRLLDEFEKQIERPGAQTPLEYARLVVEKQQPLSDFLPLTQRYYDIRFNGLHWSPGETERVNALLRLIRTSHQNPSAASNN